ncbi:MAG: hypothetical protein J6C46_01535 [Clostridia bacterium]|nr:hypothetical protein [Clostridia bacterium]
MNGKLKETTSYAFSSIIRKKWNDEVIEYLASVFNTINPRIIVLSKSVFINAALIKFDGVSFVINGADECLELVFSKKDNDKMKPVIQKILEWDAFTKHEYRFYATVDIDISRSILFDSGYRQFPKDFKDAFRNAKTEITLVGEKWNKK